MKKTFSGNIRRKKETEEFDITSLLDILTILLFFLLQNYNAAELKLDVVGKLEVAESKMVLLGQDALIVQVDQEHNLYIKNEKLTSLREPASYEKFEETLQAEKAKYSTPEDEGYPINLVFDKNLDYGLIKKIMNSSASQGFTKFKLIVQGGK